MSISKNINKRSKEYVTKIKPTLKENIKKNGKSKVLQKAFYCGYLTALTDIKNNVE
jgi:hypothetical protein